jgi:dethiobiotin synthetase
MKGYAIAGIGTEVGKTVISAIVTQALNAVYFKPIQAGDLDYGDAEKVANWCDSSISIHPTQFKLERPMAPHEAARLEGKTLRVKDIIFPSHDKPIVLEGAGGVLVPLNDEGETIADVYKASGLPVILVSRNYLGSINHTLLTIEALKNRGCEIKGVIYNGDPSPHTEDIIAKFTGINTLLHVPLATEVNAAFVQEQAKRLQPNL